MKLAFVVPRYGPEVRGGAEAGARTLAEHLVADRGYEVDVLTTCAVDAITWRTELPEGTIRINGVRVQRLAAAGRDPSFHPLWAHLREDPGRATPEEMDRWLDLQGPTSPALLEAIAASDADVIAFYPYLYHPTVRGLPLVEERAILHPAAHEEPVLHLAIYDELFRRCRGFAFHSRSERALVNARFGVATTPQVLVGLGVEEPTEVGPGVEGAATAVAVRAEHGVTDAPYLICIGRVDDQKGTGTLWRAFRAYKRRYPGPLQLVFVGQVVDAPEPAADLVVTGMIDEAAKWSLLRGARALVAPSPNESFSLTVLEALTVGVPVLVNAHCGPTREHCEQSGAGLWFGDYREFESVLSLICGDDELHSAMARRGVEYAHANFRWPVVLDRYCGFVERFASGASPASAASPALSRPAGGKGVP